MLDFNRALLLLLLLTRRLLLAVQIPVGTAGPQPRVADRSGHCRTSTASSRSQWALPDLNRDRELQIPVGTAGPQRHQDLLFGSFSETLVFEEHHHNQEYILFGLFFETLVFDEHHRNKELKNIFYLVGFLTPWFLTNITATKN